jgi:hypothetical protein
LGSTFASAIAHLGQAFLLTGEAEGESERQDVVLEFELFDEFGETAGNVVEQLDPGAVKTSPN